MFDLKNISAGFIEIGVRGPNEVFETVIDDFDDDLRKIPKFVTSLIAGNCPSDFLSDYSNCLWSYSEGSNSDTGIFRLHRQFDPLARNILSEITIEISRSDLSGALIGLAKDIAFHDNFARGYLFFASSDQRQDAFFEVVDREWEQGVKAGLFPDDIDLKDAYEDRRFIEEFPLTDRERAVLNKNQELLLSAMPKGPWNLKPSS